MAADALMGVRDTLRLLVRHPLNRDRKLSAVGRWVRWQCASLLAPGPIAVDFVNDTALLASFGMTAATGNVYAGLYEYEDMAFVGHLLRPGDLFVDVGANIGSYTILAGAVGARCLAFEPVPATHEVLRRNVQLNGLERLVDARNVAVGAAVGTVRFTATLGAMNRVARPGEAGIEVAVAPLDALVDNEAPIALKIDVEGFEAEVIAGARVTLARPTLRAVLLERNGNGARYGFDEEAIHRTILDAGFIEARYAPESRAIVTPTERPPPVYPTNTLYLRDVGFVRERLATAPALRVAGRAL